MHELVDDLRELLAANDRAALDQLCGATPPALLGELLGALTPTETWQVIGPLPKRLRAEVFGYLQPDAQIGIVDRIGRRQLAALMDRMEPDDRADFFKRLEPVVAEEMLPLMASAEREDLKRLVQAEEGTVGAVMNTDYVELPPDISVAKALVRLRHQAPDRETIYYTYVVDEHRRLIGFVSLKNIILARGDRPLRDVMREHVISVRVDADRIEAARLIERYDLVAVPVVDADDRLVGIVTHDDALDIVRQEEGEDLEHFMGMTGPAQDAPYLDVPLWIHFRRRVFWIVALLGLGLFSGVVLKHYEASLGAGNMYQALTIYVPMLINTGGNAGQQSVTTIMRSLVLGQVEASHLLRVLSKELGASLLLSVVVAIVVYFAVLLLSDAGTVHEGLGADQLALIVTLALAVHIVASALIGATLPLLASKLRLDPTTIASPALTTLADITGLVIYFNVALLLLG